MTKAQFFWYLRLIPRYAGVLGIAGLGLLAFAYMVYTQELKPFNNDLVEREIALERKFQQLRVPATAGSSVAALPKLNRKDTFTFFLRKMNDLASKNQVMLNQIDYKSQPEADGHLQRYSMQFPASARYMQMRRFMIALEQIPGVRVEAINLQRQQIADEQLNIQIQLSYLTEEN